MSDKAKFEVKVFPAQFNDAAQGTIVSIVYNHGIEKPIDPPQLEALRELVLPRFEEAIENTLCTLVTASLPNMHKLNGEYTIAAMNIHVGHESQNLVKRVQNVTTTLNLAFGS